MSEEAISGRVAVITGASSGIGLAVARELHRYGAHLVLTARRADRLASAAAELSAQAVPGDLADPGMPAELLRAALSRFGRCDIVINNAGIIEVGPIESIDIERVCAMVRVNVEGAFRVAYTFLRPADGGGWQRRPDHLHRAWAPRDGAAPGLAHSPQRKHGDLASPSARGRRPLRPVRALPAGARANPASHGAPW